MAKAREQARRTAHAVVAVPATYTRVLDDVSYPITARLHRKTDTLGDDGYAQVIVEVDRIVLSVDQIRDDPERGDKVFFHDEKVTVEIDTVEPTKYPEIPCNVRILNV